MGIRIKPVQPTEIRDIKIVREAIAQIRRKPGAAARTRDKEDEQMLRRLLHK